MFPYRSGVELTLHGKSLCRAEWDQRLVAAFKLYFGYLLIFDDTPYEKQDPTLLKWWRGGSQELCIELRDNDFQLVERNNLSVDWMRLNRPKLYGMSGNIIPAFEAIAVHGQNVIAFKPRNCRWHQLTISEKPQEVTGPSKVLVRHIGEFDSRLRTEVSAAYLPETKTQLATRRITWSLNFDWMLKFWVAGFDRLGTYVFPFWEGEAADARRSVKLRETYFKSDQDRFPPYPLYDGPWPPWGPRARLGRLWNRLRRRPNGRLIQYRPENHT
ncbi:MAG: hypothetical protein ABF335_08735 [Alphaproteobacteria bacterium]